MAPGKPVGLLKVPYPVTATSFEKDPSSGKVTVVHARYEKPADGGPPKKPKRYILQCRERVRMSSLQLLMLPSFVHWVSVSPTQHSPITAEVRVINPLFKSDNPAAHPAGFLTDINPSSEEIFPDAIIEVGFREIRRRAPWPAEAGEKNDHESAGPETVRFQGMRMGYFCVDKESEGDKVVLNRIVSLKEDTGKV